MSSFYHYNAHQQHPTTQTHGGRSRRAPRLSTSQNSHKQFRGVRSMKELTDTASITTFRQKFEAGRSFDLDDDMEFCPTLLTQDDVSTHQNKWWQFLPPTLTRQEPPLICTCHRFNPSTPHLTAHRCPADRQSLRQLSISNRLLQLSL